MSQSDWLAEFEAGARRPLEVRLRYSFIQNYKPVLDDASYRSFDTMEGYRRWCEENLPSWLGYGRDQFLRPDRELLRSVPASHSRKSLLSQNLRLVERVVGIVTVALGELGFEFNGDQGGRNDQ